VAFIAAFDMATETGIALADSRESKPQVLTWDLREGGADRPGKLAYFADALDELFEQQKPDRVAYEQPLNLAVLMEIGSGEETFALLRALAGVLECRAAKAGVPLIRPIPVQDARKYLTGRRTFPKAAKGDKLSPAKLATIQRCRALRWTARNEHEADACAIWAYEAGLANPAMAIATTPLFAGR
jgi:hypothetical protein